eukprot:2801698-Pleurochrysis_carterae.AAC.2
MSEKGRREQERSKREGEEGGVKENEATTACDSVLVEARAGAILRTSACPEWSNSTQTVQALPRAFER